MFFLKTYFYDFMTLNLILVSTSQVPYQYWKAHHHAISRGHFLYVNENPTQLF